MALMLPLVGAALGAAAMYILDPHQGRRRRALVRDQVASRSRSLRQAAQAARRDLAHRAHGLAAELRASSEPGRGLPDAQLVHRARAKMGRYVSHPGAVEVHAHDGIVVLSGPILAAEHPGLLAAIRSVRGVKGVLDTLQPHESAHGISALQGEAPRREKRFELMQHDWPPAARLLSASAGGTLLLVALRRGGALGLLAAAAGMALVVRAATNRSLHQFAGRLRHGGEHRATHVPRAYAPPLSYREAARTLTSEVNPREPGAAPTSARAMGISE